MSSDGQVSQPAVPVHKLQNGSRQSPNSNKHRNKTTHSCYYCGAQNWTREHSKVCKAKNYVCGRCGKKGNLDSLCRSARTPLHMLEAQDYSHPQSQETPQDYNQSLGTAQYSTPYFMSKKSYHRQHTTASRLYKSPEWVLMNRVNISDQPGLYSLRILRSTS